MNFFTGLQTNLLLLQTLAKLGNGDVLVFTSLSRVARSMIHMLEIEATVVAAGASIQILEMAVDTSTPQGRLTFTCSVQLPSLNARTC